MAWWRCDSAPRAVAVNPEARGFTAARSRNSIVLVVALMVRQLTARSRKRVAWCRCRPAAAGRGEGEGGAEEGKHHIIIADVIRTLDRTY